MATMIFHPDAHPEVTSVDGWVRQRYSFATGVDWATIIAAAGYDAEDDWAHSIVFLISTANPINRWDLLYRGIFLFDTSSLPDDCIVISAVLSLYGSTLFPKIDEAGWAPNINVYESAPASNIVLVAGDYDSLGSIPLCNTPITFTNWVNGAYNDFELNAAGIALISKTGVTKLGTRNANYDVAGISPVWGGISQDSYIRCHSADNTFNKPKLTITYEIVPVIINKAYALAREEK